MLGSGRPEKEWTGSGFGDFYLQVLTWVPSEVYMYFNNISFEWTYIPPDHDRQPLQVEATHGIDPSVKTMIAIPRKAIYRRERGL